jgi:hypothetical protein
LNVKDAIKILEKLDPDSELHIKTNEPSLGKLSSTEVCGVVNGIDWDAGKVFFYPATPLYKEKPECE